MQNGHRDKNLFHLFVRKDNPAVTVQSSLEGEATQII